MLSMQNIWNDVKKQGLWISMICFFRCSDLVELNFGGHAPNYDSSLFQGVSGEARAYVNSGASGFGAFYSGLPVLLDPVVALEGERVIRHRAGRAPASPPRRAGPAGSWPP